MAERKTYFVALACYDDGDTPLRVFTDRDPAIAWVGKIRREHARKPDRAANTAYDWRMHAPPRSYKMSVVEG